MEHTLNVHAHIHTQARSRTYIQIYRHSLTHTHALQAGPSGAVLVAVCVL